MHLCTSALLLVVCLSSVAHARNFCAECHTNQEVSSFKNILVWERSIYQDKNTSCPPLKRIKEEIYFTESQIVKYSQLLEELKKNGIFTRMMEKNLAEQAAAYSEAIPVKPISVEDISANTGKIKNSINKLYMQINRMRDSLRMRKIFGLVVLSTLSILFFTLIGIKKTYME